MRLTYRTIAGSIASLLVLSFVGCMGRRTIYDAPEIPTSGYYEKAWVDPKIIMSDTLFTLIQASRVDSFFVDKPQEAYKDLGPTIEFTVPIEECVVSVNLLDDRSRLVLPLMVRRLPMGSYKLTCDVRQLKPAVSSTGVYYLKSVVCDRTSIERITSQ
jgi:hypothetical protein